MYMLVIAEKPSVARDLARVLGSGKKEEAWYEGGGYRVSWAVGHLVSLCERRKSMKNGSGGACRIFPSCRRSFL